MFVELFYVDEKSKTKVVSSYGYQNIVHIVCVHQDIYEMVNGIKYFRADVIKKSANLSSSYESIDSLTTVALFVKEEDWKTIKNQ